MIKCAQIFILFLFSSSVFAQIKVACIGNSITSGYLNTGISYVPKLQQLLGPTYSVSNMGVSGTTLLKNGDSPYWRTGRISEVLSLQPDIITIKLGTNDTKPWNWDSHQSEFKRDYEALIDTLNTGRKKTKVLLVLPVPVFYNITTKDWGIRDSIIQKEIPIIKQIAQERGLPLLDANTPLIHFPQYFSIDGIHPDSKGADTIAHVIWRGIIGISTNVILPEKNSIKKNEQNQISLVMAEGLKGSILQMDPKCQYEITIFDIGGRQVHCQKGFPQLQSLHLKRLLTEISGTKLFIVKVKRQN